MVIDGLKSRKLSFSRSLSSKSKKNKAEMNKKEFLNENFLTENAYCDQTIQKVSDQKSAFKFPKKNRNSESSAFSDDFTFVPFAPLYSDEVTDDACTKDTISVFEVFEQATGAMVKSMKSMAQEEDKGELLARIEKLQKQLEEAQNIVSDLNDELDQIYTEKNDAFRKLDEMIKWSKKYDDLDHEELREVRMILTEWTETTNANTTVQPFYLRMCSCVDN